MPAASFLSTDGFPESVQEGVTRPAVRQHEALLPRGPWQMARYWRGRLRRGHVWLKHPCTRTGASATSKGGAQHPAAPTALERPRLFLVTPVPTLQTHAKSTCPSVSMCTRPTALNHPASSSLAVGAEVHGPLKPCDTVLPQLWARPSPWAHPVQR